MERLLHYGAYMLAGANGQDALFRAFVCQEWNAAVLLLVHGRMLQFKTTVTRGLEMRVKVARFRRSSITDISNTIPKVPVLTHIVAEYAGCSIVEALQLLEL
jgi:hypothetical protein